VARGATNEAFAGEVATKVIALDRPQTPRLMRLPENLADRALLAGSGRAGEIAGGGTGAAAAAPPFGDAGFEEWCLQFFETGAAYWRQRLGR
jgi:hypothetical protein